MDIKVGTRVYLKSQAEILALGLSDVTVDEIGEISFGSRYLAPNWLGKTYEVVEIRDEETVMLDNRENSGPAYIGVRREFIGAPLTSSKVYYLGVTSNGEVVKGGEVIRKEGLTLIKEFNQSKWVEVKSAHVHEEVLGVLQ